MLWGRVEQSRCFYTCRPVDLPFELQCYKENLNYRNLQDNLRELGGHTHRRAFQAASLWEGFSLHLNFSESCYKIPQIPYQRSRSELPRDKTMQNRCAIIRHCTHSRSLGRQRVILSLARLITPALHHHVEVRSGVKVVTVINYPWSTGNRTTTVQELLVFHLAPSLLGIVLATSKKSNEWNLIYCNTFCVLQVCVFVF